MLSTNASFQEDEFVNPFCTRVQEIEDNPLEQVHGNTPTMPVQKTTACTDPEMCMFAFTVGVLLNQDIRSNGLFLPWIEAMQDELHQTDEKQPSLQRKCLTSSRPDLVQAVCYCARYQARPTQKHLKEVKRIFKYLKGTINMGLWYPKDSGFELIAFSYADHAGCIDTRKSTSGGIQFLGDKLVENGIIELYFVRTEYQLADMFTKALPEDRFKYLVRRIGMRCLTPAELEVLTNESA
ncbi:hypothetical protein Tco_0742610 [Tanacetum coccineum]